MSKNKHKKLKQLQEENEKKLLQSESIRILEKYKISEGAYSLMHSSGTIGKAETMREKRIRAVQLSKAGLEIPDDDPPLTKGSFKYTLKNEASSRIESDQSGPEEVSCGDNILLLRCSKRDDCDHEESVKGHLKSGGKSSVDAENLPVQEVQENDKVFCMVEIQNNSESISHGTYTVANFPFPTPERQALLEAENCLRALEALDSQGRLTPMGSSMAQYPMSPHHSRMLLTVIQILKNQQEHGRANFVLGYAVSAAASLSFSNPFMMQFGDNHGAADDMDGGEMQDQQQK